MDDLWWIALEFPKLLSHRNCDVFVDNAGGYERDIDGVC